MKFIREWKHLYCLDKWARTNITNHLYGSSETRHDDYRELVFEVVGCQPDRINGVCLSATQAQKTAMLNKTEVTVLFDSQMFDPFLNKNDSVVGYSEVKTYPLAQGIKYEMDFDVMLGQVENERSLLTQPSTSTFHTTTPGTFQLSTNV